MMSTLPLVLLIAFVAAAQAATLPMRALKYPPKTARTLHSDAEIALARQNVKEYPAAKKLADDIIKSADQWVNWKDDDLTFLLTSPDVPRAFAVSASGCPVCGNKIKEKGGDYAWIIDPNKPFKIKCPVDGTVFPSNDYETYYRSGFKEKKDWTGPYTDDGWGWKNPKTGEKFWFVAYYNHWMWHKHLVPGLTSLGQAYLLTGETKYADKAIVMLRRIAQVYPGMDHETQSRYGEMMRARGGHYPGKVVNDIWETGLAQSVCDAYDAVFDRVSPPDRKLFEANFLEDAIDAVFDGKIRGNFGMHQGCLVHLARVRQTGETDKWFDWLMNNSSQDPATIGLNYALYDSLSRDGVPSETSPGYNFLWVAKIAEYGDVLQRAGRDVFGIPKTRRMFDAILAQVNAGEFTPDLGDTQSVWGGLTGADANTFITAYRYYQDPRYLQFVSKSGDPNFKTFESLFRDRVETPVLTPGESRVVEPQKPRVLPGYGLAILSNKPDDISLALTYGIKHGHGHFDRLNFELFADGQAIMPDLGYPDAMNDFVPGIYTWSKNTISHNTVVVDRRRQLENTDGEVKLFADSPFARVIDVEAKETYPQCSTYRRAMIMVDAGPNQSYFVDIFTVSGGSEHDYSLHGPPGEFKMTGGRWSDPQPGTLAGPDIQLGQIYDDPKLSVPGYKGGYGSYTGSGFQHLFNVRTLQSPSTPETIAANPGGGTAWFAQFKHEKDPHAQLRLRILAQSDQQILLADAHVSPGRYPQILKYLIARRTGKDLSSRFVSVIEPFKDKPFITSATFSADGDILISRGQVLDVIRYRTDGQVTVTTHEDKAAQPVRRSFTADAARPLKASVSAVDPKTCTVKLKTDPAAAGKLDGRVVLFANDRHRTACTVASAAVAGSDTTVTVAEDLIVGLAKIDAITDQKITTSTALPLDKTYRGTTLTDEKLTFFVPVASVSDGQIRLAGPLPSSHNLKPNDRVYLLNVAPGDTMEVPLVKWTGN